MLLQNKNEKNDNETNIRKIDFSPQSRLVEVLSEQRHPSRDVYGYPLEGVDEVPGSATAK